MKTPKFHSFRYRLFLAFLAVSLIPVLLCSGMLLQIFRLRLSDAAAQEAEGYLAASSHVLDTTYSELSAAAEDVCSDPEIAAALQGGDIRETFVYKRIFEAVKGQRTVARFDLYDADGNWMYSTKSTPVWEQLPSWWGVLHQAQTDTGLRFLADNTPEGSTKALLTAGAVIRGSSGETAGYLVISMGRDELRNLLEVVCGSQNDLILLNSQWRPVYSAKPNLASAAAPMLRRHLLDGTPLDGDEDFLYNVVYNEDMGLYLVLRRPHVFNRETMGLLTAVSLVSVVVCLVVSVLLSLRMSRFISRPIGHLHSAMDQVAGKNLDVQIVKEQDDELGQLAQRFNDMVTALKKNQAELVENQRELNEAQIRMLQAQLNPHFLGNTLDTMKWISKINQVPQVALMSTNLADILRFCISPEEFVSLWREIEVVNRYIEIQRIRLSDSFNFETDVPPELEDCLVPKMILQPIVENAILHGLEGIEHGTIVVRARQEQEMLIIEVEDNGCGLPSEMEGPYAHRDRELSRGHLGLYNVDTILRKYYGEGFGLVLTRPASGVGAVVRAALPCRREEDTPC